MCRFSCRVAEVQGSETTTPWAKMASLHHVANGTIAMSSDYADTWFACTGCLRCNTYCDHDTIVPRALAAGRAAAVAAGAVGPGIAAAFADLDARLRRSVDATRAVFGDRRETTDSGVVFVPGCNSARIHPDDARDSLALVERLTGGRARVTTERCCGRAHLDAGHPDRFVTLARAMLDDLGDATQVVFQDPGCLHALRVIARDVGIHSPVDLRHTTELAVAHLARFEVLTGDAAIPATTKVRYHDPCRLGRGLGIYEAPRLLLSKILGRAPDEFDHAREHAHCSGAGGSLPLTAKETAARITAERVREHEEAGAGIIVTACPGAKRSFAAAGAAVQDLGAMLRRALAS